jgi:hypothetical protein
MDTKTMRAAVVEQFGEPLVLRDVPLPTPGPGQALVKNRGQRGVPYGLTRRGWRLARQTVSPLYSGA